MPRLMLGKRSGRRKSAGLTRLRKTQIAIAVAIVLSLFAAWTMLAYAGALDSVFRQRGKKGGTVSTASFNSNSPSKEYIFAGSRLVATEESGTGGCVLTSAPSLTTTVSSGQVALSWTVPSGTASFE